MSFREKGAWVTLITLLVLTIVFFVNAPMPWSQPDPDGSIFHLLLLSIVVFVVVEIVAFAVLRLQSPREARTPKDERERLIELKSRAVAFYVMAGLSLGGTFVSLHIVGTTGVGMGYVVLWSFVGAEIVNYALRIYYYRRGF